MKGIIVANTRANLSKIVAGGGWHHDKDWRRHRKSAACMAYAVVWSSMVFLVHTLTQTSAGSSGFVGLPLAIWLLLLPTLGLVGFAFHFWRKEKATAQESKSK